MLYYSEDEADRKAPRVGDRRMRKFFCCIGIQGQWDK
jgi:hypothetical protein